MDAAISTSPDEPTDAQLDDDVPQVPGRPVPPPLDDDDDVVDAEIVESPALTPSAFGITPSTDYTDAGVPSLDYVRDKIEGRHATAIGRVELAEAAAAREAARRAVEQQQAVVTVDEQRAAREQAAKGKLDEIRRSLHP